MYNNINVLNKNNTKHFLKPADRRTQTQNMIWKVLCYIKINPKYMYLKTEISYYFDLKLSEEQNLICY
jgi:hypothetical protein